MAQYNVLDIKFSICISPGGELEVTDVSLLPRHGVGDLQVRHDEVLVVLDIFRCNAVDPTVYAGA